MSELITFHKPIYFLLWWCVLLMLVCVRVCVCLTCACHIMFCALLACNISVRQTSHSNKTNTEIGTEPQHTEKITTKYRLAATQIYRRKKQIQNECTAKACSDRSRIAFVLGNGMLSGTTSNDIFRLLRCTCMTTGGKKIAVASAIDSFDKDFFCISSLQIGKWTHRPFVVLQFKHSHSHEHTYTTRGRA